MAVFSCALIACGRINYESVDASRTDAAARADVISSFDAPSDSGVASADAGTDGSADGSRLLLMDAFVVDAAIIDGARFDAAALVDAARLDASDAILLADGADAVSEAAVPGDQSQPVSDANPACLGNPTRYDEILNGGVFLLCTADQIVSLAVSPTGWASSFEVARDINLNGRSFPPIGNAATPFSGMFFGANHEITGFRMIGTDADLGLFGVVSGFILGLELTGDVTPTGTSQNVGILAGRLSGRAQGVVVRGSIGAGQAVATAGGVVGLVEGASPAVEGVASLVSVDAARSSEAVGGLIGQMDGGALRTSFLAGSQLISGGRFTGGFVGVAVGATLESLDAMGGGLQVTSALHGGGIVGFAQSSTIRSARISIDAVRSISSPSAPFTGGACGHSIQSVFHQIIVTGGVVANGQLVGGLIGFAFDSSVTECATDMNVTGIGRTGGITGEMQNGSLRDSYAKGTVASMGSAGGLVGNLTSAAIVERAYAVGTVDGPFSVGGLVGEFSGGSILSSFSTGAITTCALWCGGLTGGRMGPVPATIMSSYWSTSSSGYAVMCGVTTGVLTCTDANGIAAAGYFLNRFNPPMDGWDFTSVWVNVTAGMLPRLRFE